LSKYSRRSILRAMGLAGVTVLAEGCGKPAVVQLLQPVIVDNPLKDYPNRDWERVYRDIAKVDSSFVFLCAPNDTHNCLLKAEVKNGQIVRIRPTYGFGKATDLYGVKASPRWDPRVCQKGLALPRKFYGDRRVKYPMLRKGFKTWVEQGFPRDPQTGKPPAELFQRGADSWVRSTWDQALEYSAKALKNIAETYSGDKGKNFLLAQGYEPECVDAVGGAGVQTMKFRGGMWLLGVTRITAQYRTANSMALLDAHVRGVKPEEAVGARGFDNYSWHTDLPPGHPMVTGQQTSDWDLCGVEHAKVAVVWGMNWITTKMPDAHWLTEARLKGTKVVVIACEYSATANKGDEVVVVRPGTTPALALGIAHQILKSKSYNPAYLKANTDLPLLVRLDNGKLLKGSDLSKDYKNAKLTNYLRVLNNEEKLPPPVKQETPLVKQSLRDEWGDCVVWDLKSGKAQPLSRDFCGANFTKSGLDPALEGTYTVTLAGGEQVKVTPVFDQVAAMAKTYDAKTCSELTWAPVQAIKNLARLFSKNKGQVLFAMGMGPNQFFNNDLKDRAVFLLAALTENVGKISGNVGSYAGNYRIAQFNGLPCYINEDPFKTQLEPDGELSVKQYWKAESAHYFNHGDKPLRMGKTMITGKTHINTPTKSIWVSNSNSLLGNIKGHYEVVYNTLPKVEFAGCNEWWWTLSCEYVDVVFPVDSWAEFKGPDLTASCTNPFLYVFPESPMPRLFDTRGDIEVASGLAEQLAKLTGDQRFSDYWKFAKKPQIYLQRILDRSNQTKGYRMEDLHDKAKEGIPSLVLSRTYPKVIGWEQGHEGKPWYTKTGRLEFYRDEDEFLAAGENLPVHREPIDSTFYEPNVIVSDPHPLLRPKGPKEYGVDEGQLDGDTRQGRNVVKSWQQLRQTQHPLVAEGQRFIFHTPKYRHGAHTTPVDIDIIDVLFGPFTDMYRRDPRQPYVGEAYVDINPQDAKQIGVEDGDYVYIDADPHDRPFHGWKDRPKEAHYARLLCRARYYPGTPRGVTRMWHNMYGACKGTVEAAENRPDHLAKSEETGYQSLFRQGSHQSCTRGYIKPTHMTDSLVRKGAFGQEIGKGFAADIHCPTGAPRESFVKITKAEDGGMDGQKLWRPAQLGYRPTYEDPAMQRFLKGEYIKEV
jgi:nitrate reductase alpha subunit